MVTVSDEILAEMVQTIVREVDPERIYLFGSRARRNERADSDVDLLIVNPSGQDIVGFEKLTRFTGRFRLFVFPRTSCSMPVTSLSNGGHRSTMSSADAIERGNFCMSDPEHAGTEGG